MKRNKRYAMFSPPKTKDSLKAVHRRDLIGFERIFSAHISLKIPEIQQVFREFLSSSGQKICTSKLLRISKEHILLQDEAKSAEILDMYFEHFQRSLAAKDAL